MNATFRDNLLDGKTVFAAGASSGINLAIVQAFAAHGAKVGIISRDAAKVEAAVATITEAGGEAMGQPADVRDYDGVAAAVEQVTKAYGPLDVVLSGAAGNFVAPALGMSANGFKAVVDIDLLGTFNVARACFEHLVKPGASIINISAPQAMIPYPFQSHVCAAKAGVDMLTKTLALEWGPAGVRVNSIIPGPIADTEGMARLAPTEEARLEARKGVPLQRLGRKEDVAALALFLCSDAASYITGAIMTCDGGLTLVGSRGLGTHADLGG